MISQVTCKRLYAPTNTLSNSLNLHCLQPIFTLSFRLQEFFRYGIDMRNDGVFSIE